MAVDRNILPLFSPLIRYPHEGQSQEVEAAISVLTGCPSAQQHLRDYKAFLEGHSQYELEEKYTQSFEINPSVALEVGFHLFGLAYQRGEFLARASLELEKVGLDQGTELADHLPTMLELAAKIEDSESAMSLIQEAIFPAVRHMCSGLNEANLMFGQAVVALHEHLNQNYKCIIHTPAVQASQEVTSHV